MTNPINPTIRTEAVPVALLALCFILSFFFFDAFPERVPTHWNFAGEPDGWSSRAFAAFFFPVLILAIYCLFLVIPKLDPKSERYAEFRKPFHVFKGAIVALLSFIYVVASLAAIGYDIPMNQVVPVAIGVMFVVLGNYFGKVKQNWFMGIRTPWTLGSEEIWQKTHRLGGKIFVGGGIALALSGFVLPAKQMPVFIAVLVALLILPMGYSYVLYRRSIRR